MPSLKRTKNEEPSVTIKLTPKQYEQICRIGKFKKETPEKTARRIVIEHLQSQTEPFIDPRD